MNQFVNVGHDQFGNRAIEPGGRKCLRPARRIRKSLMLYACAAAITPMAAAESDAQNRWLSSSGGSWDVGANWSVGVSPTLDNTVAEFNLSSSTPYTVTMGMNESAQALAVLNNSVTLDVIPGGYFGTSGVYGYVNVNASAGQIASLTINGGSPYGCDGTRFIDDDTFESDAFPGTVGGAGTTYLTVNNINVKPGQNYYNLSTGSVSVFNSVTLAGPINFDGSCTLNSCKGFVDQPGVFGGGSAAAILNISGGSDVEFIGINIGSRFGTTGFSPNPVGPAVVNIIASQAFGANNAAEVDVGTVGANSTLNISSGGIFAFSHIIIGQIRVRPLAALV